VAIAGVSVPIVDGIVLAAAVGGAELQQRGEQDLAGPGPVLWVVEVVTTSDLFQTPTTAARFGSGLAVVNAKFDTGFPPTADQYEVVVVNA
jgi:hypothetical protein